ncbi:MAG: CDP-alcohol phosphatidyltransferase family protein [Chloroflexi bacterium]|nr:CDP-alcohol phosphatidyltransferase family protein [Chloroflexota bacterium]MCH7641972.1 CDP-alcohol phosphatidyltransferase family protein [Chloroflexota bacterium]
MPSLQTARYALRGKIARWFEEPAAAALSKIGFSANLATMTGTGVAVGAGAAAADGRFLLAGALVVLGAVFDMLDGGIARLTGKVSRRGALLDSVMDRVSEGALLLGLLIFYTRGETFDQTLAILAFVAFSGSMMVSYVRARAEGLGMKGTAGFATRPERVVVIAVTLGINQPDWGLWILAIATPLSALYRFWAEWKTAGEVD